LALLDAKNSADVKKAREAHERKKELQGMALRSRVALRSAEQETADGEGSLTAAYNNALIDLSSSPAQ
jgi:hypothetical protein